MAVDSNTPDTDASTRMKPDVPLVGLCIGLVLNTCFFTMCLVDYSVDLAAEAQTERLVFLFMYYQSRGSPPVLGVVLLLMFLIALVACIDIAKGAFQTCLRSHRASIQRQATDIVEAILVILIAIPMGIAKVAPANARMMEACAPDDYAQGVQVKSSEECMTSLQAAKPLHLFMVCLQFALVILCCVKYGGNSEVKAKSE